MLDHHCTDVVEEGNIVHVSFSDKRPIQADIVIGADGIHSITRSTITTAIQKQYTGICFWGGILNKKHPVNVPANTLVNVLGIDKAAWIAPLANDQQMWYITHRMASNHLERGPDKLAQIRALCKNWSPWIDEILSAPQNEHTFSQPINELTSSTDWARNRVALIGDAAHAFGPISGQGYSVAMVDAYILAECLHHAPDNPEQALSRYKKIRGNIIKQYHHIEKKLQLITITDDELTIYNREKLYKNPPSSGVLRPILDLISPEAFERQLALAKNS